MARYVYIIASQEGLWVRDGNYRSIDGDGPYCDIYETDRADTSGAARFLIRLKQLKGQMNWKILKFESKPPYAYKGIVE